MHNTASLTYVYVGWPGSVHDARVFAYSPVYRRVTESNLLTDSSVTVNGTGIPLYFIGDATYLLQTWLMKPFPRHTVLSSDKNSTIMSSVEPA